MAAGMHAPTGASNAYDVAVKQLSGQVTSAEISTDVAINVQLGGVQLYFRLDHVVYGKRLESYGKFYEGVFPDERCNVDDDGGIGSFVGHERCGGRGCLGEFTRKCFRDFWKERGLRDRLLELRETENEDRTAHRAHVTRRRPLRTIDQRHIAGSRMS